MLTKELVTEKWDLIRRRLRTRKDGAKIAALLHGYTVLAIEMAEETEGDASIPVIVCKAPSDFHYKTLQGNDVWLDTIRWALKVTLEVECDIRLLAHTEIDLSVVQAEV